MNPIWGQIAGGFTLAMLLSFLGIWVWLWLPQHKRKFDRMAQLPMQDETAAAFGGQLHGANRAVSSLTPPPAPRVVLPSPAAWAGDVGSDLRSPASGLEITR